MTKKRKVLAGAVPKPHDVAPHVSKRDREKARRAADAIKAMRKGATLGGLKIKDLINEGRR